MTPSERRSTDPAHPQKADILLQSGIALYNIGRRPEAASMLERLLKADLSDCRCAEALNWLGKSYSRLGLREEAVESFLRLVRTYPESDWADDALYLAGNVYRDAGDMKMATKYYRRLATEYQESSFAARRAHRLQHGGGLLPPDRARGLARLRGRAAGLSRSALPVRTGVTRCWIRASVRRF